ncbi:TadE/TadG family type IV pilus assembly protein [Streptomyces sp. NPDC093097]|uniref:TadE/TadG family type IV pilus assembly protein n=1 Tax=Streptomyces sp. NPDC093097 TaxID=3366027 RepID=UPI0037F7832B
MTKRWPRARRAGRRVRAALAWLRSDDRGSGSVELSILALVVLALALISIQTGLYFHARRVAQSAARHGVEAGRQFAAGPGDGITQATTFLNKFGGSVRGAQVSSSGSTTERIRITVTGHVATLLPGLELNVSQHADAPIERWTTP